MVGRDNRQSTGRRSDEMIGGPSRLAGLKRRSSRYRPCSTITNSIKRDKVAVFINQTDHRPGKEQRDACAHGKTDLRPAIKNDDLSGSKDLEGRSQHKRKRKDFSGDPKLLPDISPEAKGIRREPSSS